MRPLILAFSVLVSSSAFALDVGQCAAPTELSALLKAKGQRAIAYGNKEVLAERLPGDN